MRFLQTHLANEWLRQFWATVLDPGTHGTRAWRAVQWLWLTSLEAAARQTQEGMAEMRTMLAWLREWAQRMESLPATQREPTGVEALNSSLRPLHDRLEEIKSDTSAIRADIAELREQGKLGSALSRGAEPVPEGPPFDEWQLPVPEHFVGRTTDLQWLVERLRGTGATQVVALRGLAGIGKTALAAIAVRQLRTDGRFRDGIVVMNCQNSSDAVEVLRAVLARFDPYRRQVEATGELAEAAQRLLRDKDALVVLDSIEPGLPIAEVVNPLRAAGATVLVIARHTLPRAVVPPDASHALDLLAPDEALDLFAQSLGRTAGGELAPAERTAAEHIVAVLERHTLAVKLAGAYAADVHRDLRALAHELEDPRQALKLPEGEMPRAVALVFARSIDTLDPNGHRLFSALAAFATPEFSRNAALTVAVGIGIAPSEVGHLLDLLILRALVNAHANEGLPPESDRERLRLHALLRAYAQVEFSRWPEEQREPAQGAMALYYASYVGVVSGLETVARLPVLDYDEANIMGALEWALTHRAAGLVLSPDET